MFMECFFKAQALITEDLKRSINERKWEIYIYNGKTAHEVSHEKYFMGKFIDAGFKLDELKVRKNIFLKNTQNQLLCCRPRIKCIIIVIHDYILHVGNKFFFSAFTIFYLFW